LDPSAANGSGSVLWQDVGVPIDWSDKTVYVAGHHGLVGSALVRALEKAGTGKVLGWRSSELDLRDRAATFDAIHEAKPDVVIDAAARVGGIMANSTYPVDFLQDNMLIQTNVMDAAHQADVDRFLFLGLLVHLPPARDPADQRVVINDRAT